MLQRQLKHSSLSLTPGATLFLILSAFFLFFILTAHPAAARGNENLNLKDLVGPRQAIPLMKPVPEPFDFSHRGLHFADPIDTSKARMTSGYGWRMHPVLKVRKLHRGVDYAAPKGTPVYATENGVVGEARWRGNYGKLVTVKHTDRVSTFYAHLSDFAPGIRPGVEVTKGEVIGYVGKTGLATGNHLYYEVVVNDERIDPLAVDLNEQVNVLAAGVTRPEGQLAKGRGLIEAQ